MKYKYLKHPTLLLAFLTFSCTGVQEYVFPLCLTKVVAPPALEDVPQTIETVDDTTSREIPPSQYAPPHSVSQPQAYDTDNRNICWGKNKSV